MHVFRIKGENLPRARPFTTFFAVCAASKFLMHCDGPVFIPVEPSWPAGHRSWHCCANPHVPAQAPGLVRCTEESRQVFSFASFSTRSGFFPVPPQTASSEALGARWKATSLGFPSFPLASLAFRLNGKEIRWKKYSEAEVLLIACPAVLPILRSLLRVPSPLPQRGRSFRPGHESRRRRTARCRTGQG